MSARKSTAALNAVTFDHPMNRKPEVEIVTITPAMASEWLGHNHRNRNQRPMRIDLYARDIAAGDWLFTGDPIRFDWDGRLIDGQHRLEACIAADVAITSLVIRNLDPGVQKVLDTNARRSAADALGFHGVEQHKSILATMAKIDMARADGLLQFTLDTSEPGRTNSEIIGWYANNPDSEAAAAMASRLQKKLKTTPGALGWVILQLSRIDSAAFYAFASDLEDMRTNGAGDPRFTLLRALENLAVNAPRRTNAAQISLWFRAWNALRANKRISVLPLSGGNTGSRGVEIPEPR